MTNDISTTAGTQAHHTDTAEQNEENFERNRKVAAVRSVEKASHPMELLFKTGTGIVFPKIGAAVEGAVLGKENAQLFVDLGAMGVGVVYGREYSAAQNMIKGMRPGDTVSGKVVDIDNERGYIELSLQEAGNEKLWSELKRMRIEDTTLELPVKKANTGGLILEYAGIEGFMPTSQLSLEHYPRVEGGDKEKIFKELQKLIGKTLQVKIFDLNPDESKLIFSEKWRDEEEVRRTLAQYKVGDAVEGTITGVVDFGAFMKIKDTELEGLIHLSEIDWTLVENPRNVVKVGDAVKAKIIDIQGDKVSLSLKQLKEDPWLKLAERYQKGAALKGKVTKFNPFGAFVHVEDGVQGLIHVSEFGTEAEMKKALTVGNEYMFTVLLFDSKEHKMYLSMAKEHNSEEKKEQKKEHNSEEKRA